MSLLGTSHVSAAVPSEQGSERSVPRGELSPCCEPITSAPGLHCSCCLSVIRTRTGGSGWWCPEHRVSRQDQDRGWSRPPCPAERTCPPAHAQKMTRLLLGVTLERICKAVLLLCLLHFVIIMILYFDVYAQHLDFFSRFNTRNASRVHPVSNSSRPNGTVPSYGPAGAEAPSPSTKPSANQTATEKPLQPCQEMPPGLGEMCGVSRRGSWTLAPSMGLMGGIPVPWVLGMSSWWSQGWSSVETPAWNWYQDSWFLQVLLVACPVSLPVFGKGFRHPLPSAVPVTPADPPHCLHY